jgi:hypothetical protein
LTIIELVLDFLGGELGLTREVAQKSTTQGEAELEREVQEL